ncbi:hypothetical protein [Burkholderia contaminans]|uniref:hypothetical protein n=1 Tax=Burkholderia contaminans TaxID=488447 RepID=UPI003C7AFAB7
MPAIPDSTRAPPNTMPSKLDSAVGHVYPRLGDTDAEALACCVDGDAKRPRDAT